MQIKEIMTSDPACCTSDTPLEEVARLMVENDCGEIPVVANRDKNVVIGVVTDRDIVCRTLAKGLNPMGLAAESCMTTGIATVTPEMSVEDVCRTMEEFRIRR
ncbi:MAG TPA: CBS domain-containing protein, partial [Pyrinomonadaceae bacterium]|nr:CBS domain-containing protein [Pyrinomonadaceae bacterium]